MNERNSDCKERAENLDETGVRNNNAALSRLEKCVAVAEMVAIFAFAIAAVFQGWARTHRF